ncbi:MAG: hypothetical protein ABI903_01595 [Actinomycetota bacterium]
MTEGDYDDDAPAAEPLKVARLRLGWSQASAMRRFQDAVTRHGATAPSGASLKRMFAYWEAGDRAVTVPAYRDAFVDIYGAPPEFLGFAPPDSSGRIDEIRCSRIELVNVDADLVALFESQTQYLRLLDRRLGSAAQAALAESHVAQIDSVLHRSVGAKRNSLAAALAEAAALAGWQALDRADLQTAWDFHETARSAAQESGSPSVLAHVIAQQAFVMLDANKPDLAVDAMTQAGAHASAVPPLMRSWLAAAEAEALAAAGRADAARRRIDQAQDLLCDEGSDELPYLMLTEEHLARWRGHCLARLGDPEAVVSLPRARGSEGDSVRAATSLHADLALALLCAGSVREAGEEARLALEMAERYGSARQRNRLLAILARSQSQVVQQPDQGP